MATRPSAYNCQAPPDPLSVSINHILSSIHSDIHVALSSILENILVALSSILENILVAPLSSILEVSENLTILLE